MKLSHCFIPKINKYKNIICGLFIGCLGCVFVFKDIILTGNYDKLWANDFDPKLIYWIVNWGYYIIFQQKQPQNFWNTNAFYPNRFTLAYSDSLFGLQFVFAPLRLLGLNPLLALYISLAFICLIGSLLTYLALKRIGGFTTLEIILIIFCAHFSLPMTSYMLHYQLFGFQLVPSFFLFLYMYLKNLQWKNLLILIIIYSFSISLSIYLAPMLLVISILISIPLLVINNKKYFLDKNIKTNIFYTLIIIILSILILYNFQFKPYIQVKKDFPVQSYSETSKYSADYNSIFTTKSIFSLWYNKVNYKKYGEWEYAYFPGYILIILTVLFLIFRIYKRLSFYICYKKNKINYGYKLNIQKSYLVEQNLINYFILLFIISVILSWGPYQKSNPAIKLPFYYLSKLIFGLRDIRAPGRFGMFIGLPLGIIATSALREIERISRHKILIIFIVLLIMFESIPKFPVYDYSIDKYGYYKMVSMIIQPGTPIIELPVCGNDNIETINNILNQLDGSTIHWGKLIVGYGSKTSREYNKLLELDCKVKNGQATPTQLVQFGKKYNIKYYLVHVNKYKYDQAILWKDIIQRNNRIIFIDNDNILFFKIE